MAWDDFEGANGTAWSGDKPMDEFALALARIAAAYVAAFNRKPTVEELCYSLRKVIAADPTAFVSDPDGLESARMIIQGD